MGRDLPNNLPSYLYINYQTLKDNKNSCVDDVYLRCALLDTVST